MGEQRNEKGEVGREVSKREERKQRILDTAAELLQRWGYRKTTIDDIAKQARVAKGTIYLHWKTREELFIALIEREQLSLSAKIEQFMAEDPEGMTLPGLIKHSMLATLKNPLVKALALQDTEFLGELITRRYSTATYQAQMQSYMTMLEFLRNHGLIRNDVDLRTQAIAVISISWGFLLIDPLLPDDFKLSDEQMVEMVDTTLKRVLEPTIPPTAEEMREGEKAFKEYMQQYMETIRQPSHKITEE
ncbi:MAG: TetR/AcrR family transcriptional regulator [Ktedonobacteraceae bacterium]